MNSNLFGDYQKLLHVDVMGQQVEVPENNTLLRGLQFHAPETISYGRFCWNGTCNNCTVTVNDGGCESKGRACRLDASEGMHVTSISSEIRRLL
jgi:hypothetical protein